MEITKIPFIERVGITKRQAGGLELALDDSVINHMNTIHASALFTLAEAASGEALQITFPEYVGKVVPVLRDSQIKYRRPATGSVSASANIDSNDISRFKQQFEKKKRSTISVDVSIKNIDGVLICSGTFNWFVQGLEQNEK